MKCSGLFRLSFKIVRVRRMVMYIATEHTAPYCGGCAVDMRPPPCHHHVIAQAVPRPSSIPRHEVLFSHALGRAHVSCVGLAGAVLMLWSYCDRRRVCHAHRQPQPAVQGRIVPEYGGRHCSASSQPQQLFPSLSVVFLGIHKSVP